MRPLTLQIAPVMSLAMPETMFDAWMNPENVLGVTPHPLHPQLDDQSYLYLTSPRAAFSLSDVPTQLSWSLRPTGALMRAPECLNMYDEGGFVTDMRSPGPLTRPTSSPTCLGTIRKRFRVSEAYQQVSSGRYRETFIFMSRFQIPMEPS